MLFLAGYYDWKGLLDLYAAVINQIELGVKDWGSDFSEERDLVLQGIRSQQIKEGAQGTYSGVRRSAPRGTSSNRIMDSHEGKAWFCRAYQSGQCSRQDPHTSWVAGRQVIVQHICAKCYIADKKKLPHPDKSDSCPHAEKAQ